MGSSAPSAERRPRTAQVALGLFICWQLWFLLSQNIIGFVHDQQEDVHQKLDTPLAKTVERIAPGWGKDKGRGHLFDFGSLILSTNKAWSDLTGQLQNWSLFPYGYRDLVFPALVWRWDDADCPPAASVARQMGVMGASNSLEALALWTALEPDEAPQTHEAQVASWQLPLLAADQPLAALTLAASACETRLDLPRETVVALSTHEPADLNSYFRWRQMRVRRFENGMVCTLAPDAGASDEERLRAWSDKIHSHLNNKGYRAQAYLKQKYAEWLDEQPAAPPPRQIIVLLRRYRSADPGAGLPHWHGPDVVPMLRWRLPQPGEAGSGHFDRYDPEHRVFRSWE